MKEKIMELQKAAIEQLEKLEVQRELQDLKVKILGKKGELTSILRNMGQLSAEERPLIGQIANEVRELLEEKFNRKSMEIDQFEEERQLGQESIDVTLPGKPLPFGGQHPLTLVARDIEDIFIGLGYEIAEGPEVEKDYYNFEALNLPKNHPARDMQDSFYITEEFLMRTHTSPVQVRTMEKKHPEVPVKIICPGRVYRRDDDDATHSHVFMQAEGLVIDRHIRMSDLKGTLLTFAKQMFGEHQQIRLRPSFFPFTEPSAEVDVSCIICDGKGCRVCKQTGWLEILGSGMVHPRVLEMSGYDPNEYSGFAFGMGLERIAMLKYGIEDIRQFYMNDMRFLQQFQRRA